MSKLMDEKSGRWIKIFKVIAVCLFIYTVFFGIVAGLGDSSAGFLDYGLGGDDDGILDFLSWVIICTVAGFVQFVIHMLIIQLLSNVQIIREKLESGHAVPQDPSSEK